MITAFGFESSGCISVFLNTCILINYSVELGGFFFIPLHPKCPVAGPGLYEWLDSLTSPQSSPTSTPFDLRPQGGRSNIDHERST